MEIVIEVGKSEVLGQPHLAYRLHWPDGDSTGWMAPGRVVDSVRDGLRRLGVSGDRERLFVERVRESLPFESGKYTVSLGDEEAMAPCPSPGCTSGMYTDETQTCSGWVWHATCGQCGYCGPREETEDEAIASHNKIAARGFPSDILISSQDVYRKRVYSRLYIVRWAGGSPEDCWSIGELTGRLVDGFKARGLPSVEAVRVANRVVGRLPHTAGEHRVSTGYSSR